MSTVRSLPPEISTGCPELDLVWKSHAQAILDRPGILIPDTDDDLTWHAFLGHSIDMQGFRAAEFAGVDPLTRPRPEFRSLRDQGVGVQELAELWNVPAIRDRLLTATANQSDAWRTPDDETLGLITSSGWAGSSLAKAFRTFPWRVRNWSVRALLQNSAALEADGFSFRNWLRRECEELGLGASEFPPSDFRRVVEVETTRYRRVVKVPTTTEQALRARLERRFHMVGWALAAYMLCDWQLWLWKEGRTGVFATFKWDSFHEEFVKRYGQGVVPTNEVAFTDWWLGLYPELPPRLANECIWIGMASRGV
jgi:hypothetical protein